MEVLVMLLHKNKKIKGFQLKNKEILAILFADDLGLILQYDEKAWSEVTFEFNRFQNLSGMKINYEKSLVYRIGSLKDSDARFYSARKLFWTKKPFKVLGVMLSTDRSELVTENIDPILNKIDSIMKLWINRGLSLSGKIQIVNLLIGSLFVHLLVVLPMIPKVYHLKFKKKIRDFIWNESSSKISMDILQGLKENGGAGLIDLIVKEKSLKIPWILKTYENSTIRNLADVILQNKIGPLLWEVNLSKKHVLSL